jgi:hypothetical protein
MKIEYTLQSKINQWMRANGWETAFLLTLLYKPLLQIVEQLKGSNSKYPKSLNLNICELKKHTCKLGWHPISSKAFTTPIWPLLTPICSGVWRRLLRALRSAPPRCKSSITAGSSPKAAWCTALSPSLSCIKDNIHIYHLTQTNWQEKGWPLSVPRYIL